MPLAQRIQLLLTAARGKIQMFLDRIDNMRVSLYRPSNLEFGLEMINIHLAAVKAVKGGGGLHEPHRSYMIRLTEDQIAAVRLAALKAIDEMSTGRVDPESPYFVP